MDIFHVFRLLGGLAMFLFGMDTMSKSLQKQAGGKLQKILGAFTGNPLKGFLLGMAVTAVIQSSGATTVMVVGFVNSGVMTLRQAIGVILGSNVGTTITAWLLSLAGVQGSGMLVEMLKPANFSPVLAFVGIVLYMFCKSEKKKGVGTILIGFGLLMIGMDNMSTAMAPLEHEVWFLQLFAHLSNPLLGVLAGALLTTVMQSSSASVGVLQALSSTGAITFGNAVPMIMGQNIGSCTTALLSSVGANKSARRTAMVHLYFNVIGSVVFLVLFYTLNSIFHFSMMGEPVDGKLDHPRFCSRAGGGPAAGSPSPGDSSGGSGSEFLHHGRHGRFGPARRDPDHGPNAQVGRKEGGRGGPAGGRIRPVRGRHWYIPGPAVQPEYERGGQPSGQYTATHHQ